MTIATELQHYNDGLLDAYDAVDAKGGTIPANLNLDNLPTAINSISGGGSSPFNPNIVASFGTDAGAFQFLGGFITDAPTVFVDSTVDSIGFNSLDYAHVLGAMFHDKKLKLNGGGASLSDLSQLAYGWNSSGGDSLGIGELDLSELVVRSTRVGMASIARLNKIIKKVLLPTMTFSPQSSLSSNVFNGCSALEEVDLGGATSSNSNTFYSAFADCTSLQKLIIRDTSRVFAINSNAFSGSAIASGTCLIYVPDSLVASYKADSVWGTYSSQIKALSDLPS